MRGRVLTLAASVLVLLGVLASPAHAAGVSVSPVQVGAASSVTPGSAGLSTQASISPCIHGEFCMYTNSGYSGEQLTWLWPTGCWNLTNQFNNTISSFHNYTESIATIYDAPNCPSFSRATKRNFAPPADIQNLNALPYWPIWNDAVSSVLFTPVNGAPTAVNVAFNIGGPGVTNPPGEGGGCAANWICGYSNAGYTGTSWGIHSPTASTRYPLGGSYNNVLTSIHNWSSTGIWLYDNADCTGSKRLLSAGDSNSNLGGFPVFFNDVTSCVGVP